MDRIPGAAWRPEPEPAATTLICYFCCPECASYWHVVGRPEPQAPMRCERCAADGVNTWVDFTDSEEIDA